MARITVEDCLDKVDNRFELIMLASKRAHQLATGGKLPKVDEENDKPAVLALREIEEGLISEEILAEQARQDALEEMADEAPSDDQDEMPTFQG